MLFKALDIAHRWRAIQSTNQIKLAGFGKLRIRFERRLDSHKALLDAGGCCNLLRTPGSSGALEAPLWGRSQTLSDRSQAALWSFLGRFQGAKLFERCRAADSIHSVCRISFASIGSSPTKMALWLLPASGACMSSAHHSIWQSGWGQKKGGSRFPPCWLMRRLPWDAADRSQQWSQGPFARERAGWVLCR